MVNRELTVGESSPRRHHCDVDVGGNTGMVEKQQQQKITQQTFMFLFVDEILNK